MAASLRGKTAIVTGASSGIGAAAARLFAQQGCRVVLAARRTDRLEDIAAEITRAGGEALPLVTDISRLNDLHNLVDQTIHAWGRIDILVNNAGFGRLKPLEDLDPVKDIQTLLQVNLIGAMQLTHLALPAMLAQKQGVIINIASLASFIHTPLYTLYGASKAGLRGFNEALRRELHGTGIQVVGIYPGSTLTEFLHHVDNPAITQPRTPDILTMSAEYVARKVVASAVHPRREIILPGIMTLPVWANGIAPGLFDGLMRWFFRKSLR